jgi:hypothetical protein
MLSAIALALAGGYAVRASSEPLQQGAPILIHLKLTVTDSADTLSQETRYVAESGESIPLKINPPFDARCVAFLPPGHQVQFNCIVRKDGKVVATPALVTNEAEAARVEFYNPKPASHTTLEVTATTSKEKISEARKAATKQT